MVPDWLLDSSRSHGTVKHLNLAALQSLGVRTAGLLVSQAFCSPLPVAYSQVPAPQWEAFARLILEGAYEATMHAAALNRERTGNPRLFLTLLGGGAFGNRDEWIVDAIERAVGVAAGYGLRINLVSYGRSKPLVRRLVEAHGDK